MDIWDFCRFLLVPLRAARLVITSRPYMCHTDLKKTMTIYDVFATADNKNKYEFEKKNVISNTFPWLIANALLHQLYWDMFQDILLIIRFVKTRSGHGLVASGNKPFTGPVLIQMINGPTRRLYATRNFRWAHICTIQTEFRNPQLYQYIPKYMYMKYVVYVCINMNIYQWAWI